VQLEPPGRIVIIVGFYREYVYGPCQRWKGHSKTDKAKIYKERVVKIPARLEDLGESH
jgi:hypothetical protein